jgi:hypothetical protein
MLRPQPRPPRSPIFFLSLRSALPPCLTQALSQEASKELMFAFNGCRSVAELDALLAREGHRANGICVSAALAQVGKVVGCLLRPGARPDVQALGSLFFPLITLSWHA